MVTRTLVKRIFTEIDALTKRLNGAHQVVVIGCPDILDHHEVEKRHFALFPEDIGSEITVFIRHYDVEGDLSDKPNKFDAAWQDLIRQENTSIPPDELRRSRALRMIQAHIDGVTGESQQFGFRNRASWIGAAVGKYGFPADEAIDLMREAGIPIDDDSVMNGFREAAASERKAA